MTQINAAGNTAATQAALLGEAASSATALTPEVLMMLLERRLDDTDQQIQGLMHNIETDTARSEAIQVKVEALQRLRTAMANKEGESGNAVSLDEVMVEYNGEQITGVELLNELQITDLSTEDGLPVNTDGLSEAERAETEERLGEIETELDDAEIRYYLRLRDRLDSNPTRLAKRRLKRRIHRAKRRIERRTGVDIDKLRTERDELQAALDPSGEAGGYQGDTKVTGTALDTYIQQLQSQGKRANADNEMNMIRMRSAMSQREQSVSMVKSMFDTLNRSLNQLAKW